MAGYDKSTGVMKRRLYIFVLLAMLLVTAYVTYTMYKVAVAESEKYQALANNQQFTSLKVAANRGSIYDANGQVLAQSVTVYTVYVDPTVYKERDTEQEEFIVSTLSSLLNVEREEVNSKLYKNNKYQVIRKDVDKNTATQLMNAMAGQGITCVGASPTAKRYYPQDDLAANVIGHLHYDGYGIYGLEAYYDDYLTGVDGKIITAVDAHGNEIQYKYKQSYEAQDGDSIYTNIDSPVALMPARSSAVVASETAAGAFRS